MNELAVKWIGRNTVVGDGWVRYGKTHAFTMMGRPGEECVSLCGRLDLTDAHWCEGDTMDMYPECGPCNKKMEKLNLSVERPSVRSHPSHYRRDRW